jgi:hypothetical protein
MFGLEKAVEDQIRQAVAEGKFDNLPGKGKPIDLKAYFQTPEPLRMAYSILKSADFAPPEVQLLKEVEALRAQLAACADEGERGRLARAINDKALRVQLGMEGLRGLKEAVRRRKP